MSSKLTIFVKAFMLAALCSLPLSAQVIHHVHPPDMHPPPRPPEDAMRKARFYKWNTGDVISAFKAQGLEVVEVASGFVIGSPGAKESAIFLIPSYGNDVGGVVSGYESEDTMRGSLRYYSDLNKDAESPAWRIFSSDNILLLISGRVPEDKARTYEKALIGMGGK